MQVVVYATLGDVPGPSFRFVAHIINEQRAKPGKPWELGFHPVVFRAETAEDARVKAETWWLEQIDAAKAKEANRIAMSERMSKRKTAPGTEIPGA